jgi:hypothetical protein
LLGLLLLCGGKTFAGDKLDFRMHALVPRGQADVVKRQAMPSDTPHYSMGIVGGGAAAHGDAPWPAEGTWGWDYHGAILPKRVWLGWLHGRNGRSATRWYQTDGPKLLHH